MIAKNRFVNAGLLLLVAMLFFVFVSDDSEAATHTVDKFGGSDYTNITQAVDNASAGDIIRVASRNYHDAVEVDKKLTIIGGNYGSEMGNLYDCNNGDLVAKYSLDEEDPSEVEELKDKLSAANADRAALISRLRDAQIQLELRTQQICELQESVIEKLSVFAGQNPIRTRSPDDVILPPQVAEWLPAAKRDDEFDS